MIFSDRDRAKANEARQAQIRKYKSMPLIRDFADDGHWQVLARQYGYRLPTWTYPPRPKTMRKWLRRFDIPEKEYLKACGYRKLTDFMELNPDWPLRAWVGVLLEYVDELRNAREILRRQPV